MIGKKNEEIDLISSVFIELAMLIELSYANV